MRVSVIVVLFSLLASAASAQTTLGYSDPSDIDTLLEYRLPDWAYRVWDADVSLQGNGSDGDSAGELRLTNRFRSALGSDFMQTWESEQRSYRISGSLDGHYERSHTGTDDGETRSRYLQGTYYLHAEARRYLGSGPVSVRLTGNSTGRYADQERNSRSLEDWTDDRDIRRLSRHEGLLGIGLGRVRNVVPLIRAQRLSERLVTLGRPALTGPQVQEIARVLAREYGYRAVFDRSDRYFWVDVLEPLLEAGRPLSTVEIFYLTDVLNEDVGARYQGWEILADYGYQETNYDDELSDSQSRYLHPVVSASWYRNLSLTRQFSLSGYWRYAWDHSGPTTWEYAHYAVEAGHLWNLTDRYSWITNVRFTGGLDHAPERREKAARMDTGFRIWVENQLSLNANAQVEYRWNRLDDQQATQWTWSYRVGLQYHLDRWFL